MRKLCVSTEYQYKVGPHEYYKVFVSKSDGTMLKGSRTLAAFTGSKLRRVVKNMQHDLDRGAYSY